jgi:hypothetical protein
MIAEIVAIFQPKRYSLMVTTTQNGKEIELHQSLTAHPAGYRAMDQMRHEFDGLYKASFSNFLKQRY